MDIFKNSSNFDWTTYSIARIKVKDSKDFFEVRLETLRGFKSRIYIFVPPSYVDPLPIYLFITSSSMSNKQSVIRKHDYLAQILLSEFVKVGKDLVKNIDPHEFIGFEFEKRISMVLCQSNLDVVGHGDLCPKSMSTICISKFATLSNTLDHSRLSEESLHKYSSLALLILQFFGRSEDETINFDEFISGFRTFDVVLLEGKAKQIFRICADENRNLDASALELALIMNYELSYRERGEELNLFDLFSSFDTENKAFLTFTQFANCMKAPGFVSSARSHDMGVLQFYYRRYVLFYDGLDFKSFCKLWCNHFADVHRELRNRGYLSRKRRQYFSLEPPWRKDVNEKRKLFEIVFASRRDVSELRDLRRVLDGWRKEIRSRTDIVHRSSRDTIKLQNRETLVKFDKRSKHSSLFFQDETERKFVVTKNRHDTMIKIFEDYEKDLSDKQDAIIRDRLEKDFIAETSLRESSNDRLDFIDSGLDCIPHPLYSNSEAQRMLSDVCILDLSKNSIKEIPDLSFCFHLQSLRKLNVANNNLSELPEGINALKSLEIMIVDYNRLSVLPSTIGQLVNLKVISCQGNLLSSLPDEVCILKHLRILNTSSNRIQSLSDKMNALEKLEVLELQMNKLCVITERLADLKNMFRLDLSSNSITFLPDVLGGLKNLEYLNLSFNRLKFLPDAMIGLENLRVVQLQGNCIVDLPECARGWKNILSFEMQDCRLKNVTTNAIKGFKNARYVALDKNSITTIPNEIAVAKAIIHLKLGNNMLEKIPSEIGALDMLESLDISNNILVDLPEEICLLKSLIWLDLSFNRIKQLPRCFGKLSKLCTIEAAHNLLYKLPDSIIQISSIISLNLAHNKFEDIPSIWCKNLKYLTSLNMDGNKIKYLPLEIIKMGNLRNLSLRHNILRAIPLEFGKRINGNGMALDIFLDGNNFQLFPVECWNKNGKIDETFFDWLNDEFSMNGPCTEEWMVSSNLYRAGKMLLSDFIAGVKWRCDQSGVEVKMDSLYRFFCICQKTGNIPCYVKLSNQEVLRRKMVTNAITNKKDNDVKIAKLKSSVKREHEQNVYFKDFEGRLKANEERHQKIQNQRLTAEKIQAKELLRKLIEDSATTNVIDNEKESNSVHMNMQKSVFHSNPRRSLPLEVKPCWIKKDDEDIKR